MNRFCNPVHSAAIGLLLVSASAALPAAAGAPRPTPGASLALGSDYLFRGVSQTLGRPAIYGSLDVEFESGLYGYVWASNVDFVPDGGVDDGASIEIDAAAGYVTGIGERLALDAMLVHYRFPGTAAGVDYDYTEIVGTLTLDDRYAATIALSDDVFGSGRTGVLYAVGAGLVDRAGYTVTFDVGHYDLGNAYGGAYSYAELALGRSFGALSVTLALVDTFGDAVALFPAAAVGERAVLTVGMDW